MKVLTCDVGRSQCYTEALSARNLFSTGRGWGSIRIKPKGLFLRHLSLSGIFYSTLWLFVFLVGGSKCVFELNKGRRLTISSFPLLCVCILSFNINENLETAGKFFSYCGLGTEHKGRFSAC